MDMTGEQRIPASRDVVWKALNDPDILQACIPGCQELIKASDTEMTAIAVIKVGPVSARFQGAVTLSDLDPPNGYRITGEGQGGVAGFAKGTAIVRLEADGDDTILTYEVTAQIGGKLSQLGGRLIDATAKQMSLAFFKRFAQEIEAQDNEVTPMTTSADESGPTAGEAVTAVKRDATSARSRPPRVPEPPPSSPGFFHFLNPSLLLLLVTTGAAGWLFLSGAMPRLISGGPGTNSVSPDFAALLQLLVVAAIGYLFGRHGKPTASRTVVIDADLLDVLMTSRRSRL